MTPKNNHSTSRRSGKLKSKIEDLEFMNKMGKEVIAEMLKLMGEDGKKSYPKQWKILPGKSKSESKHPGRTVWGKPSSLA